MLLVPDWSFGALDHIFYFLSNLTGRKPPCVIFELCANFQLPSKIISASRTQSYLEDIGGF